MVLANKANTDDQHTIFLLKKNVKVEIIKTIICQHYRSHFYYLFHWSNQSYLSLQLPYYQEHSPPNLDRLHQVYIYIPTLSPRLRERGCNGLEQSQRKWLEAQRPIYYSRVCKSATDRRHCARNPFFSNLTSPLFSMTLLKESEEVRGIERISLPGWCRSHESEQ